MVAKLLQLYEVEDIAILYNKHYVFIWESTITNMLISIKEGKRERRRKGKREEKKEKKEKKGKENADSPQESYDMRRVGCRAVRSTPAPTRQQACHNSPKGWFASTTFLLPPCSTSSPSSKNPPKRLAEWEVQKNPIFPKTSFLA